MDRNIRAVLFHFLFLQKKELRTVHSLDASHFHIISVWHFRYKPHRPDSEGLQHAHLSATGELAKSAHSLCVRKTSVRSN